jgi:hypothetical protein
MPGVGGLNTTSSTVEYPTYVKEQYREILNSTAGDADTTFLTTTWNIINDVDTERDSSPYELVNAYDPAAELAKINGRLEDFQDAVDLMDGDLDIDDALTEGLARYEATMNTDARVAEVVAASENRALGAYVRDLGRTMAGMFDIRATMNTQYGQALAIGAAEHESTMADVEARLYFQIERERHAAVLSIAQLILGRSNDKIKCLQAAAGMQSEVSKMSIVALQDQIGMDLNYELKDRLWNLDLYEYAHRGLGAISGAAVFPKGQTTADRLLASLTTSASFGIQMGTAMGGVEAGLIGGGAMLAAQLFSIFAGGGSGR